MTSDQYTELIGFLSRKFEGIDRRFDGVDQRFDGVDRKFEAIDRRFEESRREHAEDLEATRRHANVLFEQLRKEMRLMMEGIEARFEAL